MFHVQIRQGREVARAFNQSEEQVRERFINRLRQGTEFGYADKLWEPARTRIIVLEGRELRNDELMLGRGWGSAQKVGEDVTERLLNTAAPVLGPVPGMPALERLKDRILGRLVAGSLEVREIVAIAGDLQPGALVSVRLALAEEAVWTLLHGGGTSLAVDGVPVAADDWREVLLAVGSWIGTGVPVTLSRQAS